MSLSLRGRIIICTILLIVGAVIMMFLFISNYVRFGDLSNLLFNFSLYSNSMFILTTNWAWERLFLESTLLSQYIAAFLRDYLSYVSATFGLSIGAIIGMHLTLKFQNKRSD